MGWKASSAGGCAKISHPSPASTLDHPRTSRKNARSASASRLYTIAWTPVIIYRDCRGDASASPVPAVGCAAADHADDLDLVTVGQRTVGVGLPLEDLAVHLDRDGPWVHAHLADVVEQRRGAGQAHRLPVDAQRDHRAW